MKTMIRGVIWAAMPPRVPACNHFFAGSNPAPFRGTKSLAVPHQPGTAIEVATDNGSIEICQTDRTDVEIHADFRATTQERLDAASIQAQRTEDGTLRITIDWPDGRRRNAEGCSFEIAVPDAVGVELSSSNGSLTVRGLSGTAELHTSNGKVDVEDHAGPIEVHTSNGAIQSRQVAGEIDARTSNGPIDVTDAPAAVTAHTSNAAITIRKADGNVDATTSNGRIEVIDASQAVVAKTSNASVSLQLAPHGPGPLDVHTSNGAVDLELSPAFRGELFLESVSGHIRAKDLPGARLVSTGEDQMQLAFGESQVRSTATTSNGTLTVRMLPESALPSEP